MRKVNKITWDLVVKELNLSGVKKGETINIIKTKNVWEETNGNLRGSNKSDFLQIKAR